MQLKPYGSATGAQMVIDPSLSVTTTLVSFVCWSRKASNRAAGAIAVWAVLVIVIV